MGSIFLMKFDLLYYMYDSQCQTNLINLRRLNHKSSRGWGFVTR
jgi:hypothetical protein